MKLKLLYFAFASLIFTSAKAQEQTNLTTKNSKAVERPKLVIGMVVDQMRWDYLYRFSARYTAGGFKRLLKDGFSAQNLVIPYAPTITACGHATVYTGTVPAISGIIGNNWFDKQIGRDVYCVEDKDVKTVGSTSAAGLMSPKNLLVTTVTDELKIATNFRSKVISVSQKDRGAILPGGHTANGSYWYDSKSGNYITSTHYMSDLPYWVKDFNNRKLPSAYLEKDWNTLYPIETYTESTADDKKYERPFKGEKTASFPHLFKQYAGNNYEMLTSMPYGNTFTLEFAKSAIAAENLGKSGNTDFLAISLSSTDYVGHQFGPNSIEIEDTYLRLDKDLEAFFKYLDKEVGKQNYLLFLTADHAATHVPGFSIENKLPGGVLSTRKFQKDLDSILLQDFKVKDGIFTIMNNQIIFDREVIKAAKADFSKVKTACIDHLIKQNGVFNAIDLQNLANETIPQELKDRIINGYNTRRSGDIYIITDSGWYSSSLGTGHGAWNAYDSHIPAIFMGWGVKKGKTHKPYYMTDIAPTISALLNIQEPSGSIGKVITELIKYDYKLQKSL